MFHGQGQCKVSWNSRQARLQVTFSLPLCLQPAHRAVLKASCCMGWLQKGAPFHTPSPDTDYLAACPPCLLAGQWQLGAGAGCPPSRRPPAAQHLHIMLVLLHCCYTGSSFFPIGLSNRVPAGSKVLVRKWKRKLGCKSRLDRIVGYLFAWSTTWQDFKVVQY